jgi:arginyl-tRNA synthetase
VLSRGLKVLNIKNEESKDVQTQRLLLFITARTVLGNGMKILGLRPLKKM